MHLSKPQLRGGNHAVGLKEDLCVEMGTAEKLP